MVDNFSLSVSWWFPISRSLVVGVLFFLRLFCSPISSCGCPSSSSFFEVVQIPFFLKFVVSILSLFFVVLLCLFLLRRGLAPPQESEKTIFRGGSLLSLVVKKFRALHHSLWWGPFILFLKRRQGKATTITGPGPSRYG